MKLTLDGLKPFKCECCEKRNATTFSFLTEGARIKAGGKGICHLTCSVCEEAYYHYWVRIKDVFADPLTAIEWLAHLSEKSLWFDAEDFMKTIRRLRQKGDCFGGVPSAEGT